MLRSTGPSRSSASYPQLAVEKPRVMVGCDDRAVLAEVRRELRKAGFQVATARAGGRLMRDLHRCLRGTLRHEPIELLVLARSKRPGAAMLLLEEVRNLDPALPVILVASLDDEQRTEAMRLGVDRVLSWPADPMQICEAAQQLVPAFPDVDAEVG